MGLLGACRDPSDRYDRFVEHTRDDRENPIRLDMGGTEALPDITGTFLLALATPLDPELPLQFIASTTLTYNATQTAGVLDLELQPLRLDVGSRTEPRVPLGNRFVLLGLGIRGDEGLAFALSDARMRDGVNPLGTGPIVGTFEFEARVQSADLWCGEVLGALESPQEIDLEGSTFAAVRVPSADPAVLPDDVQTECEP